MRWLCFSVVFCVGCSFLVDGLKVPNGSDDGGVNDPATVGGDLAGTLGDLPSSTAPPDLAPSFTPSHVAVGDFGLGSASLIVTMTIRTDPGALLVDGAAPPAGVHFAVENNLAVLAVASLRVPSGATVHVTGSLPLVIIALGDIVIDGVLDAGGHGVTPGPGGAASAAGASPGGNGVGGAGGSTGDSGGAGGGFGAAGGNSGTDSGCGGGPYGTAAGATGGAATGDATLTTLAGGSGGGRGSPGACNVQQYPNAVGGAGGGAVQLTAAGAIKIGGSINVGGGGGQGGCKDPAHLDSGSGAGGGSGGALLLEAPSLTVSGALAANGGGGGGGGFYSAGGAGGDGAASATAASGGVAGNDMPNGNNEATIDHGGIGSSANVGGDSLVDGACGNTGGGGGGAGRIYLRSRGAASLSGASISPAATSSASL